MDFKSKIKSFSRIIPLPVKIWIYNKINYVHNKSYYKMELLYANIRYHIFTSSKYKSTSYKNIPIIINNFNRLSYLQNLIYSLEIRGYKNIYIIDNNSTYPPLLDYYKKCPYKIFRLKSNIGHKAIWETNIYNLFKRSYYVYTDSDMQIDNNCPDNFMEFFLHVLHIHPFAQKVGFGIRIDDLPDHFNLKKEVIEHEKQFWNNPISYNLYKAKIDTTFALYRPYCSGAASNNYITYRTGFPYLIKHLPWYIDSSNIDEEELYYLNTIKTSTHWSKICINK